MRALLKLVSAVVAVALVTVAGWSQNLKPREGTLKVGDTAPDFAVKDLEGKNEVKLSDLKGKPVVLVFGSCT